MAAILLLPKKALNSKILKALLVPSRRIRSFLKQGLCRFRENVREGSTRPNFPWPKGIAGDPDLLKESAGQEGIITPRKGKGDPHLGPDALMVMIPSELRYLAGAIRAASVPFSDGDLYKLYLSRPQTGPPITLCGPFLGAPQAVMGMERLIALGARRIWVLGWCGSIKPGLGIGDIVIPESALSEEGTSAHYPIGDRPVRSDLKLNRMLESALKQGGVPFSMGPVWTTDAPYRETPEKVKTYADLGVLAVEMEMSALMTVALYRSVAMAGLLVVSDELFDLKWRRGFSDPSLRQSSRAAGRVLLTVAFPSIAI